MDALKHEMDVRRHEVKEAVQTIYLGGGTPSQLGSYCVRQILDAVAERFDLSQCHEITMEANPEDIAHGPAWQWGRINRVSMGVQTMVDEELRLLHRRHDAEAVRMAVNTLRRDGIRNLSLDLMYGLPTQTINSWEYSIEQVLNLKPEHISSYNLMVEEGTRLHTMVEHGELTPCDDDTCLEMAELLRKRLKAAGYEQYEISNYARPGYESKHNSSYWVQTAYLGLGPGAHSYDGERTRSWNAADLPSYLALRQDREEEKLSDHDIYNERIMLGLRTRRGIDLVELRRLNRHLNDNTLDLTLASLLKRGLVEVKDAVEPEGKTPYVRLTREGLALADEVMRELMLT